MKINSYQIQFYQDLPRARGLAPRQQQRPVTYCFIFSDSVDGALREARRRNVEPISITMQGRGNQGYETFVDIDVLPKLIADQQKSTSKQRKAADPNQD